jgi:hypothetical protein
MKGKIFKILRSMMNKKIILIPALCIASFAFSQTRERDLGSEQIEILGEFNPVIKDAVKISGNPVITDTTKKIPVSAYRFSDNKITTTFEADPIPSAKMKAEPLTRINRTHVKGGFGNYSMPLGEIYFNSLRSKDYHFGAALRHLSSSATLPDVAYSGFSNNNVSLFGRYFMDSYTLSADFDYARNAVHYYGFNPETFANIERGDIRQRFNTFNPKIELSSTHKDTLKLMNRTGAEFYNISDLFDGARENHVGVNSSLKKYFGDHLGGLNTNIGFWDLQSPADTAQDVLVSLNPHILTSVNRFNFRVGGILAFETGSDQAGNVFPYPDIEASFDVINKIIIPYAGATGGLERNSYRSLTAINPFMGIYGPLLNTNTRIKGYGGIRGVLSSKMTFNTMFSYSDLKNMPLFVSTIDQVPNRFAVIYDNVRLMNVRAELGYQKTDKLKFLLKGDYFKYDLDVQQYAWHRPELELTFTTFYSLRDKIIVKGDIFYVGKRFATREIMNSPFDYPSFGVFELKPFVDVNLGLEYRYTKHLSAFVNLNNIGAVRYQQWYNYPVQRLNILGGFTYSF